MSSAKKAPSAAPSFVLPKLPYAYDALAPAISADTLKQHHDGHHKKYVDDTNALAAEAGMGGQSLAAIIRATAGKPSMKKLFNAAAQAWNHAFYWRSLSPKATAPEGELKAMIERSFGSLDELLESLRTEAAAHFASGWAWLVEKDGALEIVTTHDAATPLTEAGTKPLLTIDVWEHAYYLDHKRDRAAYLKGVTAERLDWGFAATALAAKDAGDLDLGLE